VTKLAENGTTLGTFPVGHGPVDLVFDGANIWAANGLDGTVTKLRASDGANLGSFPVGTPTMQAGPLHLAFDGAHIWVATGTDKVAKL
jgi:DNA-binding beta-propeller fold protein YncE